MAKLREGLKKLPIPVTILISVVLTAAFIFSMRGASALLKLTSISQDSAYLLQAIGELLPLIIFLVITILFGYAFIFKQNRSGWTAGFYYGGFFTVYCGSLLGAGILRGFMTDSEFVPAWQIIIFVVAVMLIGFVEELVFRGVILNVLLDRFPATGGGIRAAILIDAAVFGLMHMFNALSGVNILSVCIQTIQAFLLGIVFACIYAKTRNFWLAALFHFLVDFTSLFSSGVHSGGSLAVSLNKTTSLTPAIVVSFIVLLIPAIILLLDKNTEKIISMEKGEPLTETSGEILSYSRISMIFGIISIATCWFVGYSIGFGALSLTAAAMARRNGLKNRMTKTGTILSIFGMAVGVCVVIAFAIYFSMIDVSELYASLNPFA